METKNWMYIPDIILWLGLSYFLFTQTDYFYLALTFAITFPMISLSGNENPMDQIPLYIYFVVALLVSFFLIPDWVSETKFDKDVTLNQENIPQPEKSAKGKPAQYSAADACEDISTIQYEYFEEFDEFRFRNDGKGWGPLKTLTDKATSRLAKSITKIDQGISWDSDVISSGMLSTASSYMTEIVDSSNRRYFSPGRDLEALLQEIELNLASVANSACN